MKFRSETLAHRVIIKPFIETQTKSGIVIAKDERKQAVDSDKGIIYLIGPTAWKDFGLDKPVVAEGDQVYYAKYGAKVLKDDETGELYIICNDEDVLVGYTNE